jgi:hypothetical protein
MPVTLDSFRTLTQQPVTDKRSIQVKDDKVAFTSRWSWRSPSAEANLKAITTFVKALRTEYGDGIANMIEKGILKGHASKGKPLTGYMVQDLIKLAKEENNRVAEHNSSVIKQFLSGQDKGGQPQPKNLDTAMDGFCQEKKIPPGGRDVIKTQVKDFLLGQAKTGGFNPTVLNLDTLLAGVKGGRPEYVGDGTLYLVEDLAQSPAQSPGGGSSTSDLSKQTNDRVSVPGKPNVIPSSTLAKEWNNKTEAHPTGVCEAAVTMWMENMMDGKSHELIPGEAKYCDYLQTQMIDGKTSWVSELANHQLEVNKKNNESLRISFDGSSANYSSTVLKGEGAQGFGWLEKNLHPEGGFAFLSSSSPKAFTTGHAIGVFRTGPDSFSVFDPNKGLYKTNGAGLAKQLDDNNKIWPMVTATVGRIADLTKPAKTVSELMLNGFDKAVMVTAKNTKLFRELFYSNNYGSPYLDEIRAWVGLRVQEEIDRDSDLKSLWDKAAKEEEKGELGQETGQKLLAAIESIMKQALEDDLMILSGTDRQDNLLGDGSTHDLLTKRINNIRTNIKPQS